MIGKAIGGDKTPTEAKPDTEQSQSTDKSGSEAKPEEKPADEAKPAEEAPKLVLKATATGKGHVSWGTAGASNSADFEGTWEMEIPDYKDGEVYTVTVVGDILEGGDNQEMSCTIIKDGKEIDTKSATGKTASVICSTPLW